MEPSSFYGSPIFYFVIGLAILCVGIFFLIALVRAIISKRRGWIIGAVVSGALSLLGVAAMMSAVVGSVAKLAKAASEKKTMASKDGRFRVEVPATWRELPELHEEAQIEAGNAVAEQYVIVIENLKSDYAGTLAEFDELTTGQMKGSVPDIEVSAPELRPVGSYPAIHRRLAGTVDKVGIVYHIASVETGAGFYKVLTWTSPSRETAALPVFRGVIDSFTSTDGPPGPKPARAATNASIHERVVLIVTDQLGIKAQAVKPESRFIEDLGADSLDTVELVMATEEEFDVSIPDEVAEKLITVGDLVRWLEKNPVEVEQ
jgi:acyl carrier protein